MANTFVPDQSDDFKKKMKLITDPASDVLLAKAHLMTKKKEDKVKER